ncbi:MAG: DUF1588 domain-containing protein [Deltaproteobacteria bacterium]|nr:DUF1588 domain-containing protein [Deltaproteobacteria bacterium]
MCSVRAHRQALLLVAALAFGACEHPHMPKVVAPPVVDAGTADAVVTPSFTCAQAPAPRVRRLSQREYLNVVEDLLGTQARQRAATLLPAEPNIAGFDNQDDALRVGSLMQGAFAVVAETLSREALPNAVCELGEARQACVDRFAMAFAHRAFGRAPTAAERAALTTLSDQADDTPTALRLVIEYVLQAPGTLYSTELGHVTPTLDPSLLTDNELANQIALLTTAARPDETLTTVASLGLLALPEHRQMQVERLLQTPRGRAQAQRLILGWLDMDDVATAPKNGDAFAAYSAEVATAMQAEIDAFVRAHSFGPDATLQALFTDTSQHIPAALFSIYGDELQMTEHGSVLSPVFRRGVLSLPAWLTYHAADQHSGPIERGLLVRRQLLCQQVPSPPPDLAVQIAAQTIDATDKARTTRQKYEQHRSEPRCAGCHTAFDAIGFGLEDMDGLGRHRTTENELPVDAQGMLLDTDVDGAFVGVAQLSEKLAHSRAVSDCFVQQFFRFAAGRPATDADQCVIADLQQAFEQHGNRIDSLFLAFVGHASFERRVRP